MALVQDLNGFKAAWATTDPSDVESIGGQLGQLFGQLFVCGGSGTQEVSRLGVYFNDGSGPGTFRLCIYTDSAGSPGSLVANSATSEITVNTGGAGWHVPFDYGTKPQVTGGSSYWLLAWGGTGADWRAGGEFESAGSKIAATTYHATNNPSPGAWAALDYHIAIQAVFAAAAGAETITMDKWSAKIPDVIRRKIGVVPSGTIGIKA